MTVLMPQVPSWGRDAARAASADRTVAAVQGSEALGARGRFVHRRTVLVAGRDGGPGCGWRPGAGGTRPT